MATVSLSYRFLRKRISFLIVAITGFSSVGFAQPALFEVASTPYDKQMARVEPTLTAPSGYTFDRISFTLVNEWISQLRAMPYRYSREWHTPSEVEAARAADCKGKAMVLYDWLQLNGATDVRFVIGKRRATALLTHAWLEWGTKTGVYVLDPTFNWAARAKLQDRSTYIAFYAYKGHHKYQVADSAFVSRRRDTRSPAAPSQGAISRPVRSGSKFRSVQIPFDELPINPMFANRMAL
jgi:predicted transglutaminase-like cysteine proteinase